jgi:hypothetical protein
MLTLAALNKPLRVARPFRQSMRSFIPHLADQGAGIDLCWRASDAALAQPLDVGVGYWSWLCASLKATGRSSTTS